VSDEAGFSNFSAVLLYAFAQCQFLASILESADVFHSFEDAIPALEQLSKLPNVDLIIFSNGRWWVNGILLMLSIPPVNSVILSYV